MIFKEDLEKSLAEAAAQQEQDSVRAEAARQQKLQAEKDDVEKREATTKDRLFRQKDEFDSIIEKSSLHQLFEDAAEVVHGKYKIGYGLKTEVDNLTDLLVDAQRITSTSYVGFENSNIDRATVTLKWHEESAFEYDYVSVEILQNHSIRVREREFSEREWKNNLQVLGDTLKLEILHPLHAFPPEPDNFPYPC